MNIIKFTITIVAPVGVATKYEIINPVINANIEIITLEITTLLNVLNTCIDDNVGKIIKLEINNAPIKRIPSTTTTEHRLANIIL